MAGKHQDLKYISPEIVSEPLGNLPHTGSQCPSAGSTVTSFCPPQMASVLNGKFASLIKEFVIIDCRYPYEYEGGHIKVGFRAH